MVPQNCSTQKSVTPKPHGNSNSPFLPQNFPTLEINTPQKICSLKVQVYIARNKRVSIGKIEES
jgi:hypothetical protein